MARPPSSAPPNPQRAAALAWMAETGHGYSRCAQHFGLPVGRVKEWDKVERKRAKAAHDVDPTAPPPRPPCPPREGATRPGAFPRSTHGPGVKAEPPPAPVTPTAVAALGPDVHRGLRAGARAVGLYLEVCERQMQAYLKAEREGGPLPEMPDWRRYDSALRGARTAAEFAAALAGLDESTGGKGGESGGPTEAERTKARAMMLADDPAPRALSVVPGGRAATG